VPFLCEKIWRLQASIKIKVLKLIAPFSSIRITELGHCKWREATGEKVKKNQGIFYDTPDLLWKTVMGALDVVPGISRTGELIVP